MNWNRKSFVYIGLAFFILSGLRWLHHLGSPMARVPAPSVIRSDLLGFERSARFTISHTKHDGSAVTSVKTGSRAVINWSKAKVKQVERAGVVAALTTPPAEEDFKAVEQTEFNEGNEHGEAQANEGEEGDQDVVENEEESVCESDEDDSEECLEERERKAAEKEENGEAEEEAEEVADQEAERTKEEEARRELERLQAEKEKEEAEKNGGSGTTYVSGAGISYPQNVVNQDPTLEYWRTLLLSRADRAATLKFIEAYQNGTVNDQTFYAIVREMAKDNRQDMRKMALLSVSAVPSQESFMILSDLLKAEPYGSNLASEITSNFQTYSAIRYISTMKKVLYASGSITSKVKAIEVIEQMAERYLAHKSDDNPDDPPSAPQPTDPKQAQNEKKFSEILPDLRRLSESSKDAEVRDGLQQLVSKLENLLGETTAVANL